ncbi:MAG: acyl-CoA thioesterase [Pseudomonadales bacterium]
MKNKPDALRAYPVHFAKQVEWGDMDAMQHVNNVRYFYYAESARLQLLAEIFPAFADGSLAQSGEAFTLAETSCRYKTSLTWPDQIEIGSVVESVDDTSFIVKHAIYSAKFDCIAAELHARLVRYDYVQRCRSQITPDERTVLEKYRLRESR